MKMKMCFVVLEKLDEKQINQYLKKCDFKKTTKNTDSKISSDPTVKENLINRKGYIKTEKNSDGSRRHKRSSSKDSAIEKLRRKKRKIKRSGYTASVSSKSDSEISKVVTEDDKTVKLRVTPDAADNIEGLNRTCESDRNVTVQYKESTTLEIKEERSKITIETLLEGSSSCKSPELCTEVTKFELVSDSLNHKNEIQNKNCDKTEASHSQEHIPDTRDSVQAMLFEEEESDSREENEDDKETVIFEEKICEDLDLDAFDTNEKEIDLSSSELKKGEKINQESPKLTEFTKNFDERNIETATRPVMEPSIGQKATEVPPLPEGINEDCIRVVCCMIQRLHELYKFIIHLQMKLQNNNALSVKFSKMISSQQEQFQKEIRKSQETIIKSYEKMLLLYKNADEVALIISKRTSLSPNEVIEIISHCLCVEGASELTKSGPKDGKEVFQPLKALCNSDSLVEKVNENSERLHGRKMAQKPNYHVPSSQSFFPSVENSILRQTLTDKSMLIQRIPTKEISKIYSQSPSNRVSGISPPQYQMQEIQHENPKSYLMQRKLRSQGLVQNPRVNEIQQAQRQPFVIMPPNLPRHPRSGFACPNRNVILPYPRFYSDNVPQLRHSNFLTVPTRPVSNTEQFMSFCSKNSSANQIDRNSRDISKSGPGVLIPMAAGNIVQRNPPPYPRNLLNAPFLPPPRMVNSQRQVLNPSNETLCPLNWVGFRNQNFVNFLPRGLLPYPGEMAESHFRVEGNINAELRGHPSRVSEESQVLDPTVPKKLTMKNHRLQAGPSLYHETEKVTESRNKKNACQSWEKKKLDCQELGNPYEGDSRTRKYFCAQTDCKNPGVQICQGCHSIIYCSKDCQLKNWIHKHRSECYQLRELRG